MSIAKVLLYGLTDRFTGGVEDALYARLDDELRNGLRRGLTDTLYDGLFYGLHDGLSRGLRDALQTKSENQS